MSTFNDREKGYENEFSHKQEIGFKVTARRNKLLGLWAAQQLGLSADAASAYALALIELEIETHGDAAVLDKVMRDLEAKGVHCTREQVQDRLQRFAAEARKQLMSE
jgi:hypothetical protein